MRQRLWHAARLVDRLWAVCGVGSMLDLGWDGKEGAALVGGALGEVAFDGGVCQAAADSREEHEEGPLDARCDTAGREGERRVARVVRHERAHEEGWEGSQHDGGEVAAACAPSLWYHGGRQGLDTWQRPECRLTLADRRTADDGLLVATVLRGPPSSKHRLSARQGIHRIIECGWLFVQQVCNACW